MPADKGIDAGSRGFRLAVQIDGYLLVRRGRVTALGIEYQELPVKVRLVAVERAVARRGHFSRVTAGSEPSAFSWH
jgi:hypothetical protein